MIKRQIKETESEYDQNGKLVRQTTTETTEEDDTPYVPYNPYNPCGYTFITSPNTNSTGGV